MFCSYGLLLSAQRTDTTRVPITAARLVSFYYDIDFDSTQRAYLADKEVELVYLIDTAGYAELTGINPDLPADIADSLHTRTTRLPRFSYRDTEPNQPPQEFLYGVMFDFPGYDDRTAAPRGNPAPQRGGYVNGMLLFNRAGPDDFVYLTRTTRRLGVAFGGHLAQPIGQRASYLATGGGMHIHIDYSDEKARTYGLLMTFDGNRRMEELPLTSSLAQGAAPPTLTVGLSYGRDIGPLLLRGELGLSQMNLTETVDNEFVESSGWSVGLVADYLIPLGQGSSEFMYGSPTVSVGNLCPKLALRYYHLDVSELRGLSLEIGVNYRLIAYGVKDFKYRPEYLN